MWAIRRVAECDEMVDRLVQALVVSGADHVEGVVPNRAGDDDDGQAHGEIGQIGRRRWGPSRMSASQRSCNRLATARRSSRPGVTALSASS